MNDYTSEQLKELQVEFQSLKRYKERISFFDSKFNIIPFPFPAFSIHLGIFFDTKITNSLIDIFKSESNNPKLTKRQITAGKEKCTFDITPTNSNNQVYNSFIISKFLQVGSEQTDFENNTTAYFESRDKTLEHRLDYTNKIVNDIESLLNIGYNKVLVYQFMKIFYLGFRDEYTSAVKPIYKKKKFTILYLYSLGIWYARYLAAIKTVMFEKKQSTMGSQNLETKNI